MPQIEWVDLPRHEHPSGTIIVAEAESRVPFAIERVYWLYGLDPTARRGLHAHRELEQVLFCLHGQCRILLDDGETKAEALVDSPGRGLLIRRMMWREMFDFTSDCVIMVLASRHYDERDYIRDYGEFLSLAGASRAAR